MQASAFSSLNGKNVGQFGDIAPFHLSRKNLGAMGDAGALVSNRSDIAEFSKIFKPFDNLKVCHEFDGINSRMDLFEHLY